MDAELAALAQKAAGTLVSLLATDAWHKATEGLARLWRRVHPERVATVQAELAEARAQLTAVGADGEREQVTDELTAEWRGRLGRLLAADPQIKDELSRLFEQVLAPALTEATETAGPSVHRVHQVAKVEGDDAQVIQVGRDLNIGRP